MDAEVAQNMKLASEIFQEHGDTIRSAIRFHINDKSDIEDIFQDFFLSLVQKPVLRRDQNIKAFIHKAIKNDVLDAAAKSRNSLLRNSRYAQMQKERFQSQTPEEIVIHAEEIGQLFEIVENQLLQHEAEAIIHKYRHGRDAGETAEVMDINRRSVSSYLCTGIKKLRDLVCNKNILQKEGLADAE